MGAPDGLYYSSIGITLIINDNVINEFLVLIVYVKSCRDTVPPSWIGPNVDNMQESSSEVAIRVTTDIPILHDGYAWRKYGEKSIKNHKFTRSVS